ncbi:MAG: NADH-quinone oxidoreductase subunit NuoK [Thermoanaerobaculia bacterium]|nr:NADH-quinone oxidoreductase subunit NuoK [Thermoanaerobaculia bacterium]
MTAVPITWYLLLSAILFTVGTVGALTRRNAITIFLSIELMLNSANLAVLAYARLAAARAGDALAATHGQVLVLVVIAVAAAEAAVGLALFIAVYRNRRTIDVTRLNLLRW